MLSTLRDRMVASGHSGPSAQVSTTKRNPKVNNGFGVMMCQGRSVNSDKSSLHCGVRH